MNLLALFFCQKLIFLDFVFRNIKKGEPNGPPLGMMKN